MSTAPMIAGSRPASAADDPLGLMESAIDELLNHCTQSGMGTEATNVIARISVLIEKLRHLKQEFCSRPKSLADGSPGGQAMEGIRHRNAVAVAYIAGGDIVVPEPGKLRLWFWEPANVPADVLDDVERMNEDLASGRPIIDSTGVQVRLDEAHPGLPLSEEILAGFAEFVSRRTHSQILID